MKKTAIVLCALLVLMAGISGLHAQDVKFGLKGGVTYYTGTFSAGEFEETTDPSIGFTGGLFAEFPVSDFLSIQPEVLYIQKNSEESDDFFGETETNKSKLSFVDVPVLLRFNVPLDGGFKPFILAGPYAGYLIEAVNEFDGESEDISEFFNDINYGVVFGAGAQIGALSLEARYDLGLANLYDAEALGDDFFDPGDIDVTLSGFSVLLGISF